MTITRGSTLFVPGSVPGTDTWCVACLQADGTLAYQPVRLGPPLPAPPPGPVRPGGGLPGDILKLANWKLTLPCGKARAATQIKQPQLGTYTDEFFHVDPVTGGVVLQAHCDAPTTSGSAYPRCELRQMVGPTEEAAWSCGTGRNTMTVRLSVDVLPPRKPQVVCAQIHNATDDVIEVLGDAVNAKAGKGHTAITVRMRGATQPVHLDPDYTLGTPFTLTIDVNDGQIAILYNGALRLALRANDPDCYFKTGAYVQSNKTTGDDGAAYGQVTIYDLIAYTH
jgi:hypothetical protein